MFCIYLKNIILSMALGSIVRSGLRILTGGKNLWCVVVFLIPFPCLIPHAWGGAGERAGKVRSQWRMEMRSQRQRHQLELLPGTELGPRDYLTV